MGFLLLIIKRFRNKSPSENNYDIAIQELKNLESIVRQGNKEEKRFVILNQPFI